MAHMVSGSNPAKRRRRRDMCCAMEKGFPDHFSKGRARKIGELP